MNENTGLSIKNSKTIETIGYVNLHIPLIDNLLTSIINSVILVILESKGYQMLNIIFNFEGQQLRTIKDHKNEEWFHAKDVCNCLKFSNVSKTISDYIKPDWKKEYNDGVRGGKAAWYISEPALFKLIFKSKTEMAEIFQDWVFDVVLPELKKLGLVKDNSRFSPEENQQIEKVVADRDFRIKELEAANKISQKEKEILETKLYKSNQLHEGLTLKKIFIHFEELGFGIYQPRKKAIVNELTNDYERVGNRGSTKDAQIFKYQDDCKVVHKNLKTIDDGGMTAASFSSKFIF